MSEYISVGYRLEFMHTPTGVTVELYDADDTDQYSAPLASVTGATADDAVADLINYVTFNLGDAAPNGGEPGEGGGVFDLTMVGLVPYICICKAITSHHIT